MDADHVKRYVCETFDGMNVMEANGDFFIYDPDHDLPPQRQIPFVTIVTGDSYDAVSDLSRPGAYRLNIGLTKATYTARFGQPPSERDEHGILLTGHDYAAPDVLVPHPYYGSQYWVSVVNPSDATFERLRPLLAEAHAFAARKYANSRSRHAGPAETAPESAPESAPETSAQTPAGTPPEE